MYSSARVHTHLGHDMKQCTGAPREKAGEVRMKQLYFL